MSASPNQIPEHDLLTWAACCLQAYPLIFKSLQQKRPKDRRRWSGLQAPSPINADGLSSRLHSANARPSVNALGDLQRNDSRRESTAETGRS